MNRLHDNHIVICACKSSEHILHFSYDRESNELYTSVQLGNYPYFFQRLKNAIKYIFGYKCRYGHWDCTLIPPEEANKLYHFLKRHKDTLND